jgi:hypothetical protein
VVISVVLGFHIEEVENPKCFVSLLTQDYIGGNPSGKFSSSLKRKIYLTDRYVYGGCWVFVGPLIRMFERHFFVYCTSDLEY